MTTFSLSQLLLTAEHAGHLSAEGWSALREVLLTSRDPTIAHATERLRALVSARTAVSDAHQQMLAAIPAFTRQDMSDLPSLEAQTNQLMLLLDELAARIDQLKQLHTS